MAYCETNDLLVQDGMVARPGEKERFIEHAADEIDSKLGYIYVVPINISEEGPGTPWLPLPANQRKLLKMINVKLATGRFLMGQASASEQMQAYALYLVKEAETELLSIANGQIDLMAPKVGPNGQPLDGDVMPPEIADSFARVPTGWNPDQVSPVTAFENNFMRGWPGVPPIPWVPGENIEGDGRVEKVI